jgi:hypothetical protein
MRITNVEFQDIDHGDAPDYCDAFISYAEYLDGTPLTQDELDAINDDGSVVYELLMKHIY